MKAVNIKSICKYNRFIISEYSHDKADKVFVYDLQKEEPYNLKGGISGGDYSFGEPVELFPLNGRPNEVYFISQRLSEASTDEEPNPSVYLMRMKDN